MAPTGFGDARCHSGGETMARIHILGASGSGTSTLGAAVAEALDVPHLDTDDFYWLKTEPPFTSPRAREERIALLLERMEGRDSWVLSGSATGWGQPLEPLYQLIVFCVLDPGIRMSRLRAREVQRYGERIARGGDRAAAHAEFLDWATRYDTAGLEQRSQTTHEAWLATQPSPILRLDTAGRVADLARQVIAAAAAVRQ